jgi:hypothetical protein
VGKGEGGGTRRFVASRTQFPVYSNSLRGWNVQDVTTFDFHYTKNDYSCAPLYIATLIAMVLFYTSTYTRFLLYVCVFYSGTRTAVFHVWGTLVSSRRTTNRT